MKKNIIFFIVFSILLPAAPICALSTQEAQKGITSGQKKFEKIEGQHCYHFGDYETPHQADRIALLLALRDALESNSIFIHSKSQISNFELTDDFIDSISSGLIKNLKKERTPPQGELPSDWKICYRITGLIDPEQLDSKMEEFQGLRKMNSEFAMEAIKESVLGFWRTNNGSLIQLKFKGDDVLAYIASASPVSSQLGYKNGDIIFKGRIDGSTARGEFLSRYDLRKKSCYSKGRSVQAFAWIKNDTQGFFLEIEIHDKKIDENCNDISPITIRETLRREIGKYYNREKQFSIDIPPEWERKEEYNDITFIAYSPQENLNDRFRESVAVYAQAVSPQISLDEYFNQNIVSIGILNDYKQLNTGTETIGDNIARWITFLHSSEGFRIKVVMYFLKKNNIGYILLFSTESHKFSEYSKKFKEISNSFRLLE